MNTTGLTARSCKRCINSKTSLARLQNEHKINKSNIPCSQNLPSHPSAQTHVNDPMPSRQLPPFLHEMFSQLSISENSKKILRRDLHIDQNLETNQGVQLFILNWTQHTLTFVAVVPCVIFVTSALIISHRQRFTSTMFTTHSRIPQNWGTINYEGLQARIDHWKRKWKWLTQSAQEL